MNIQQLWSLKTKTNHLHLKYVDMTKKTAFSPIYLFIHLFIHLFIYLFIYLSIYLFLPDNSIEHEEN